MHSCTLRVDRGREKTTTGRLFRQSPVFFFGAVAALLTTGSPAAGEPQLTEAEAVRLALSRPVVAALEEGRLARARADEVRAGLWANPELTYAREETLGDRGVFQDYVTVSQSFDLSGGRGLRRSAAALRSQAAAHDNEARRLELERQVRLRYHELLSQQLRERALRSFAARVERALSVVARREAAGDTPAYDRRRLERELGNARVLVSAVQADTVPAWAELAWLIGRPDEAGGPPPVLAGPLLPDAPAAAAAVIDVLAQRPDIVALGAEEEAASREAEAASRWWVPRPTLTGGWTGVGPGPDAADGYVAEVAFALPLFDREQAAALRAIGDSSVARWRRELALEQARSTVRGRVAQLEIVLSASRRFRDEVVDRNAALIQTAEAGFAGGELGILELLDAYRGALADEMTATDVDLTARRARIELDLATGGDTR